MTVHNSSAGPAVLPNQVIERAQAEFLDYNGSGNECLRCRIAPRTLMISI